MSLKLKVNPISSDFFCTFPLWLLKLVMGKLSGFIFCFLFIYPPGYSQVTFRRLSVQEGISNSSVIAITQDDDHFLWFGTRDGLNRFDGYNIQIFRKEGGNPNSILFDETGYQIEYSIDGGKSYQVLKNLPSNTTQYTFSDAGFNKNTLFRLVAKGEKGWSPYTYSTTALVTTSTTNTLSQMGITIYPNPSGNILKISSSSPLKNGVIYHLNGTKLKEWQWENGMEISVSLIELPQGQYFISLSSDNQKTAVGSFQKY